MTQENEIQLRKLDNSFGEGKYLSWKDKESKRVVITNWGVYDKIDEEGKTQLAFRCDVLRVDDIEFLPGNKVIDTTSLNFHKAIKPFVMTDKNAIYLEIERIGEKQKTNFKIRALKVGEKQ